MYDSLDVKGHEHVFVSRIRFMRISSEMFPFASHAKYGYDLDYAAKELKVGAVNILPGEQLAQFRVRLQVI